MSSRGDRHEGVSCDSCTKNNFSGRRYKCLVCFDFDLCGDCFDSGQATTEQHSVDHPVQCILTRDDFELYYGNESVSPEQPQALACPFCRSLGFTEAGLHEHLASEHAEAAEFSFDVVCPVCAAMPNGEPNRMVSDLLGHLALEHMGSRMQSDEHGNSGPRRMARGRQTAIRGRGTSRVLMEARGGLQSVSVPRETNLSSDPITELLNQLGGLRRGTTYSSTLAQIQQLQQQLGRGGGNQSARRAVVATLPRDASSTNRERSYADALWEELASSARQKSATAVPSEGEIPPLSGAGTASTSNSETGTLLLPKLFMEGSKADAETSKAVKAEKGRLAMGLLMESLTESLVDLEIAAVATEEKEVQVEEEAKTESSATQTPNHLVPEAPSGGAEHKAGSRIRKVIINCAYDQ